LIKNIKNVLLYNSGGGLGDSLSIIPLIQWLKDYYQLSKIYFSSKNKETKDLTSEDIINFVNDFT
jgi:hypothetical protein